MKVIDLLNKIAKGEEVPKKIRITILDDRITRKYNFFYDEDDQEYKDDEVFPLGARLILERVLNEKVEIIEEEPKRIEGLEEIREITQDCFDNWTCAKRINQLNENQKKIIKAVNYLLEKESDK